MPMPIAYNDVHVIPFDFFYFISFASSIVLFISAKYCKIFDPQWNLCRNIDRNWCFALFSLFTTSTSVAHESIDEREEKKLSIVWFHKTLKLSSVSPLTQPHWLFTISFVLAEVFCYWSLFLLCKMHLTQWWWRRQHQRRQIEQKKNRRLTPYEKLNITSGKQTVMVSSVDWKWCKMNNQQQRRQRTKRKKLTTKW